MKKTNNVMRLHDPGFNRANNEIVISALKCALRFHPFSLCWTIHKEAVSEVFSKISRRPITSMEVDAILLASKDFMEEMTEAYMYCRDYSAHNYNGVVVLEGFDPDQSIKIPFKSKAESIILANGAYELEVTLLTATDHQYYSRKYARYVNKEFQEEQKALLKRLSERELEVFRLFAEGKTVKEVAAALFLSTHTIESHKQSIYRKLELKGLVEMGMMAERLGL